MKPRIPSHSRHRLTIRRENLHRFDPQARWTWREERAVVKKIDWKIMAWTCIMFVGLEIDRANLGQAVSDNMLDDLGLTTNGRSDTRYSLSWMLADEEAPPHRRL